MKTYSIIHPRGQGVWKLPGSLLRSMKLFRSNLRNATFRTCVVKYTKISFYLIAICNCWILLLLLFLRLLSWDITFILYIFYIYIANIYYIWFWNIYNVYITFFISGIQGKNNNLFFFGIFRLLPLSIHHQYIDK